MLQPVQKIKGIIFDLDGTIADTLPLCIKAFRNAIGPLINRPVSDEEIIATFGPSEEGTIMALAPKHYEKGVAGYLHFYKEFHGMCSEPFEGIKELLAFLQEAGVAIAMVTGKGQYSTHISLEQFGLTKYFHLLETGWPQGPRKAAGIGAILQQWKHLNKEEVVYVGDAPADIDASRKAGIPVMAAAWAPAADAGKLGPLHPDELFYSVADFKKWILDRI